MKTKCRNTCLSAGRVLSGAEGRRTEAASHCETGGRSNPCFAPVLIAALILFASCGKTTVREAIHPQYRFEPGQVTGYKFVFSGDITADAGLFRFNGTVGVEMDGELKTVTSNSWGWKNQLSMKNPKVTGATGQANTAVMSALNFVRSYLSVIYMQTNGRATVPFQNAPNEGLSSYAQIVFPDFSDMDALNGAGTHQKVEFGVKMQDKPMMEVVVIDSRIDRVNPPYLVLSRTASVKFYDVDEYRNSADPKPQIGADITMTDRFDYVRGVLVSKDGYFFVDGAVKMSRGILGYTISISGNGTFRMDEVVPPVE